MTQRNGLPIKASSHTMHPLFLPVITAVPSDPMIFSFCFKEYLLLQRTWM